VRGGRHHASLARLGAVRALDIDRADVDTLVRRARGCVSTITVAVEDAFKFHHETRYDHRRPK
jgi:hypothetical protein